MLYQAEEKEIASRSEVTVMREAAGMRISNVNRNRNRNWMSISRYIAEMYEAREEKEEELSAKYGEKLTPAAEAIKEEKQPASAILALRSSINVEIS